MDLNEDILLETDISPTADELLALVCEQPFLIDVTLERTLPRIKRYAEDNFGCNICYKPRIRSYGLVICDINNNKDSSSSFVYEFISSMSKGRVKVLNCL